MLGICTGRREKIKEKARSRKHWISNIGGEIVLKQHGDQKEKDGCGPQVILKYGNTLNAVTDITDHFSILISNIWPSPDYTQSNLANIYGVFFRG